MAAEKVAYQDPTANILNFFTNLGGSKQSSSSSSSVSVDPGSTEALRRILESQMGGTTPEGAAKLLEAIFTEGMRQVPQLATTYAQTRGARVSGNSPMQLAMQDLMLQLTREGAKQLSQNQQNASQTAGKLADSTRTENRTGTQKTKGNLMALAPFALGQLGKLKKGGDLFGGLFGNSGSGQAALSSFGFDGSGFTNFGNNAGLGASYGIEPSMDFLDVAGDFGAEAVGDFAFDQSADMFGFDYGGGDLLGSAADFGGWDMGGTEFLDGGWLGFANGGLVSKKKYQAARMQPKGYANGGKVKKTSGDDALFGDTTFNLLDNAGEELRGITYNESMNRRQQLLNGILGGGGSGAAPGGRNAARKAAQDRIKKRRQASGLEVPGDTGSSGVGEGVAEGTVGTGITAEGLGTVASIAGMATGVPGMAVAAALNAIGFPTVSPVMAFINAITDVPVTPPNPFAVDGDAGIGTSSVTAEGVAEATGIAGANNGGLAGMGVTMGLDAAFDPSDAPGIGGVGDGATSTGGTDGVGDAASAGVGGGGFARGGEVDGPKGHDVIPAMLTDGEYVIKKDSVNRVGTHMLDMLNDNPEVFEELARAFFRAPSKSMGMKGR